MGDCQARFRERGGRKSLFLLDIINYSNMANLNRIKVVLVEKGKTGKWLAEEIGKTPCTVSKWCSNSIQPDLITLDKIAKLSYKEIQGFKFTG